MKNSDRKKDNRIILSGLILAAVVVVACFFGYRYLKNYFDEASKRTHQEQAKLSQEMQMELAQTAAPGTPTPAPTAEPGAQEEVPQAPQQTVLPETQHDMVLTPTQEPWEYWAAHGTPTPYAPTEPATARMTSAFEAESSSYEKLNIAYAYASSVLTPYDAETDYSAQMAFDGDPATSWQEGVEGAGEGQVLNGVLDRTYRVAYVTFRVGNWKNSERWKANARPADVTVWLGGNGFEISFTDSQTEFCMALSREVSASDISIEINTVFPGDDTNYTDTCISEVTLYGRV